MTNKQLKITHVFSAIEEFLDPYIDVRTTFFRSNTLKSYRKERKRQLRWVDSPSHLSRKVFVHY